MRFLLQHIPECQLNLPYFNPYLKSNKALFTYRLLLKNFQHNTEEDNSRFIHDVTKYIIEFKKKLFEQLDGAGGESIEKILPMFHALIYLFTHHKFNDREKMK